MCTCSQDAYFHFLHQWCHIPMMRVGCVPEAGGHCQWWQSSWWGQFWLEFLREFMWTIVLPSGYCQKIIYFPNYLSKPSLLPIFVQVMALVYVTTLSSHIWLLSLAPWSGSMNNLPLRTGISGCRPFTWPLDPNSSLQFPWVAGYDTHTNQPFTSPMTQLWISFINWATMEYGMFSPSSPMPWSVTASHVTCTPELPPQFPHSLPPGLWIPRPSPNASFLGL